LVSSLSSSALQDVQIAASGNNVYVSWSERNATSNEPVFRVSNDNGKKPVSHANGDHIHASNITGNGIIIGKQIHIEGDVIVNLSNEAKSNGLNLLPPKYFEDHKGTD
jgi:hypothetical protein